jgi:hypothetical protein
MMSTAASLLLVVKPRFIEPVGESQTLEGDAYYLRDSSGQFIRRLVQGFALRQQQRGTCTQHNQELCSHLMMRLSISPVCCKQRIERIEW